MYTYVWEFAVRPEMDDRFRDLYGPEGAWVALFRRAHGHVSTQLYRDQRNPHRYLTVDTWTSREEHAAFRRQFATAFAELDGRGAALTVRETLVGEFEALEG